MSNQPPILDEYSKHAISFMVPVYAALKASAARAGLEPNELIQQLVLDRVIADGTLDKDVQRQLETYRWLVDHAVEVAKAICRQGDFKPSLTADALVICARDPEWADRYRSYVQDDIYKHGNPRKGPINREIGYRIRQGIGGVIQKDSQGKPVLQKVLGQVIQTYTPLVSYAPSTL